MKHYAKISYRQVIPKQYCIPQPILASFKDIIAEKITKKKTGRPLSHDEDILAGIYYLLKTGCQWQALPLCFGSGKTVYGWFRRLVKLDVFKESWRAIIDQYDEKRGLELNHQIVDSCHKKSPLGGDKTGKSPVDRRKLGSKIVLIVDKNGIPLALTLAGSNRHDSQLLKDIFDDLEYKIKQSRNHYFHTDKGFLSRKNKSFIISRNYCPIMPVKKRRNQKIHIDHAKDIFRWVIERTFSWLSRFRRLFTRYERKSSHYEAFVQFACQIIVFNKI